MGLFNLLNFSPLQLQANKDIINSSRLQLELKTLLCFVFVTQRNMKHSASLSWLYSPLN